MRRGAILAVILSFGILAATFARAKTDNDACAELAVVNPYAYEQTVLEQLVGAKPIITPTGEKSIKDRSLGYFETDLELARTFLESEIAKWGFKSQRQTFAVDVKALFPTFTIKDGTSISNVRKVEFIKAMTESLAENIQRLLPPHQAYSNIIVDIPGTDPAAQDVILLAHYDTHSVLGTAAADQGYLSKPTAGASYWVSPGADDNGSGVVTLLSVLRRLADSKQRLKHNLKIVFLDGEEANPFYRQQTGEVLILGRKGSGHFVSQLSQQQKDNIRIAVNLDTVGSAPFKRNFAAELTHLQYTNAGVAAFKVIGESPLRFELESNSRSQLLKYSDSVHFDRAQIPIATFSSLSHFGKIPDYVNSAGDNLDKINWESFGPFMDFIWEFVKGVGDASSAGIVQPQR